MDSATCNDTCLAPANSGSRYGVQNVDAFSNWNTLVNSSSLHRTVLSANSFFMGIFPPDTSQDLYLGFQVRPSRQAFTTHQSIVETGLAANDHSPPGSDLPEKAD
jgi:hypothetical protein